MGKIFLSVSISKIEITALIATTKSLVGNKTSKLSKVILYINESPKVFTKKELKIKHNIKEITAVIIWFILRLLKSTPGIKPQSPVPIPIIGLYAPKGATIPQIRSPMNADANPRPLPNIYPDKNPTVATNEICNTSLTFMV